MAHCFDNLWPVTVLTQVRTWNFPALARYLTPLNGLYFSPYMSRRLTLRPVQRGEKRREGLPTKSTIELKVNTIATICKLLLQLNPSTAELKRYVWDQFTWYGQLLYLQVNVEWGVLFRFGGPCLHAQTASQVRKLLGVQFANVPNQHLPK